MEKVKTKIAGAVKQFKQAVSRRLSRGALAGVMVLFLASVAWAVPVEVINFNALMTLIQNKLTDTITQRLQTLWQNELTQWKMALGLFGMQGSAVDANGIKDVLACKGAEGTTNTYIGSFGQSYGGFATGKGSPSWDDAIKQSTVKLPSDDNCTPDRNNKYVLGLLAGPAGNRDRSAMSNPDIADVHLADLKKQTSMKAWNMSVQNSTMATQTKDKLKEFTPTSWDGALPEQATKDMAKLIYFQTMMEANQMQAEAAHEMRKSLQWR